jgi:prepilin-type N-terminal cleavage/methylation domain-containing protein
MMKIRKCLPAGRQGFTLIELLVTIAVIGVMMGAVIVAINPAKRLADARDSDGKTRVASVATAMESCFAMSMTGSYANCDTVAKLVSGGYLKQDPTGVAPTGCTAAKCCYYYTLENGATSTAYWIYQSGTGKAAEFSALSCP